MAVLMSMAVTSCEKKSDAQTVTTENESYIEERCENANTLLSEYGCADEILNLLKNPDNKEYSDAAQEYTERVSESIPNLEGIYASTWETEVLVHTKSEYRGMVTRQGENVTNLQELLINSPDNIYNAGVIVSPRDGKNIISAYKAVFNENGNPIGFAGIGIYADDLVTE